MSAESIFDAGSASVLRRFDAEGLGELTPQEVDVYWLTLAYGAIGNGGFRSWYERHAGISPVADAFDNIRLPDIAAACRISLTAFEKSAPSDDHRQRLRQVNERRKEIQELWAVAETDVFERWNEIPAKFAEFAMSNQSQLRDIDDQIEINRAFAKVVPASGRDWKGLRGSKKVVVAISRFIQREHLLVLFQYPSSISLALDMASALERIGIDDGANHLLAAAHSVAGSGALADVDAPLVLEKASKDLIAALGYLNDELRNLKVRAAHQLADLLRTKQLIIR